MSSYASNGHWVLRSSEPLNSSLPSLIDKKNITIVDKYIDDTNGYYLAKAGRPFMLMLRDGILANDQDLVDILIDDRYFHLPNGEALAVLSDKFASKVKVYLNGRELLPIILALIEEEEIIIAKRRKKDPVKFYGKNTTGLVMPIVFKR